EAALFVDFFRCQIAIFTGFGLFADAGLGIQHGFGVLCLLAFFRVLVGNALQALRFRASTGLPFGGFAGGGCRCGLSCRSRARVDQAARARGDLYALGLATFRRLLGVVDRG